MLKCLGCAISNRNASGLRFFHEVYEELQALDKLGLKVFVSPDILAQFLDLVLHFLLGALRTVKVADRRLQCWIVGLFPGKRRPRFL